MLAGIPAAPLWSRDCMETFHGGVEGEQEVKHPLLAGGLGRKGTWWHLRGDAHSHTSGYGGNGTQVCTLFVQLLSHLAFSGWQYFPLVTKMADLIAWPFSADTPYPGRWFESNWNYSTHFVIHGFLKFDYFMIHFTKFSHNPSPSALNLFQI